MAGLNMADLTVEQVMDHLYAALDAKNVDQFQILINEAQQEGKELKLSSAWNHEKSTLLQRACELEDETIVKILLEAKIDVNEISETNPIPPLILAVEKGNVEILKLLLEDPAIKLDISEPEYGATALHAVIGKMGKTNFPEAMIKFDGCLDVLLNLPHTINVNVKNKKDKTPLHMAAHYGLQGAIVKLLNKGANPYLKNIYKQTSFYSLFSSLYYTEKKVDQLIDCFKSMLTFDNTDQELRQLLEPDSSILHDLLTAPKLVETQEEIEIFIQCLDLIIKLPTTDIDIRDENGLTPLHFVAKYICVEAIELLLENGANPSLTTNDGENIFHFLACIARLPSFNGAEKYNRLEIVLEKLTIGENKNSIIPMINQKNNFGATPLSIACYRESEEIVKLLLRNGAHLDKISCELICPATLESFFDSCIEIPIIDRGIPDSTRLARFTFNYSSLLTTPTFTKSQAVEISSMPANNTIQVVNSGNNATEETSLQIHPPQEDENLRSELKEDNIIYSETETLWYLSQFPRHQHLLDHPLVKSFLMLKWHCFRNFYWNSVAIYALYLIVLFSPYILLLYSGWNYPIALNVLWCLVTVFNTAFFVLELLQCFMIPYSYLRTKENWIDVPLMLLTFWILFPPGEDPNSVKHLSAVAILLAWSEGLVLLSRHPKFSTYVTMFTKVSESFLYLFAWFSALLIGFAFSFFLIFGQTPEIVQINSLAKENNGTSSEEKRQFINIYDTFLKTLVMMKDEYDFGDLPFGGVISRLFFVVFMFLVTIVMMNLFNGLAIYDIQDIKKQAEMYSYKSQLESFTTREFVLLLGDPSHKLRRWTSIHKILGRYSPITTTKLDKRNGIIKYLYRKAFLFYNKFPEKTSITFSFEGEIDKYSNEPTSNSPVPKNYRKFKLKREVLQRAQQMARENKREADQRATRIKPSNNTSRKLNETERLTNEVRQFVEPQKERNSMDNLKMEKLKSELLFAMKQQLEDVISNIKHQHCNEMKELKQHHQDEINELKQLLSEFRLLLQDKNA